MLIHDTNIGISQANMNRADKERPNVVFRGYKQKNRLSMKLFYVLGSVCELEKTTFGRYFFDISLFCLSPPGMDVTICH